MAKIGHDAKAINFVKRVSLAQKIKKAKKMQKNDFTTTLELLCARKPLQKHLIFEK